MIRSSGICPQKKQNGHSYFPKMSPTFLFMLI